MCLHLYISRPRFRIKSPELRARVHIEGDMWIHSRYCLVGTVLHARSVLNSSVPRVQVSLLHSEERDMVTLVLLLLWQSAYRYRKPGTGRRQCSTGTLEYVLNETRNCCMKRAAGTPPTSWVPWLLL